MGDKQICVEFIREELVVNLQRNKIQMLNEGAQVQMTHTGHEVQGRKTMDPREGIRAYVGTSLLVALFM